MKTLKRNQIPVKYALFIERKEILDSNGYRTGQYENIYSDPVDIRANVSSAKGQADSELFGINLNYTRTLVTDDMNCPIDEHSVLWIDSEKYNYVVVRVAKGLDSIAYALKEVDVNA